MHRRRFRTMLAFATVGATVVVCATGVTLAALNGHPGPVSGAVATVVFAGVGGLIVVRQPANRVGWLLCVATLAMALLGTAKEYAQRTLVLAPGSLPAGEVAAYLMMWLPLLAIGLLVAVLPQVFPDGRPLSR